MDSLRAMRTFVRTVELGSLSAAARELGTTQPTVSKLLAQLEQQLAVRLFERSTRGPVALGQYRINAMVQQFLAAHPGIDIELILNDRFVDLVEEGVDIAFRLGGRLPPDAIGRHLASTPRMLVASPAYLDRRGAPAEPGDLAEHDFVRFAWTPGAAVDLVRGRDEVRVPTSSRYRVNNALAIREALVLGSGIGLCPAWLVRDLLDSGELVRVLEDWSARPQELHLLYPSRQYQPLRARLFIDFAAGHFGSLPGFDRPAAYAGMERDMT